jgi:hypothetical protein
MMAMSSDPDQGSVECRRIAELLGEYVEGTLPGATLELIEWHIDGCGPCVAFLNTYRTTIRTAGQIPDVPIPPELKQRLLTVLRASRQDESRP